MRTSYTSPMNSTGYSTRAGRPADARNADRRRANRHPCIVSISYENVGKFRFSGSLDRFRCHCLRLMHMFTDTIVRIPIARLSIVFAQHQVICGGCRIIFRTTRFFDARTLTIGAYYDLCFLILVLFLPRLAPMKLRKLSVITV